MNPIESAVAKYAPVKLFAMFSGGNDSLPATHYSMEHGAHAVFHIRTGIGLKETTDFVIETCKAHGWPLVIKDPPKIDYRHMVLRWGFPGPGAHLYPYVWLKQRAIEELVRESKTKRSDRIGLLTGVRNTESARRMGYVQPIMKEKARVWIAPMFDFDTLRLVEYTRQHNLKINPVTKLIGFSGECFCGAFAEQPPEVELEKLRKHFPYLYEQIMVLQAEASIAGVHCQWGTRPPKLRDADQYDIPFMPLCVSCHK